MATVEKQEQKSSISFDQLEVSNQLEEYFGNIEQNLRGDPYNIAHGYILGTLLLQQDNDNLRVIAKEHVNKCKAICSKPDIFKAIIDNGSDGKEIGLIKLADFVAEIAKQ